jgi:hypothetical protein
VVVRLDYDPEIVGLAAQPLWVHWRDGRRARRHAPDYFARRADGTAMVIDVRADDRIKDNDAEAFAATARACAQAGWSFVRVGARAGGDRREFALAGRLPSSALLAGPCR